MGLASNDDLPTASLKDVENLENIFFIGRAYILSFENSKEQRHLYPTPIISGPTFSYRLISIPTSSKEEAAIKMSETAIDDDTFNGTLFPVFVTAEATLDVSQEHY